MKLNTRWLRYPETVVAVFLLGTAALSYLPSVYSPIFYFLVALWVIILAKRYFAMRNKIHSMFGGQLLNAFETPRPSTSMLVALKLQGVNSKDIKKIDMMTYDLTEACRYLESRGKKFSNLLKSNRDITVDIYGSGTVCDNSLPENFMFHPLDYVLTEHTNKVVTLKGDRFVWYEPEHTVKDGEHKLSLGAYLVKIDNDEDWSKVESKFDEAIYEASRH